MSARLGLAALALAALGAGCAGGPGPPAGAGRDSIAVTRAWVRATVPGARAGAAYMVLRSAGGDRLVGAAVAPAIAADAELHAIVTDSLGRAGMREIEALALPAGRAVALEPGGLHLMLVGLARPIAAGDTVALTLRFERAGARTVRAIARAR